MFCAAVHGQKLFNCAGKKKSPRLISRPSFNLTEFGEKEKEKKNQDWTIIFCSVFMIDPCILR